MKCYILYHHGILGMQWGKRNGPPYPLGAGDHSASEKKAGWRKSLGHMKLSDTQKKVIKATIIVGGVAIAAGILYKSGAFNAMASKGHLVVQRLLQKGGNDTIRKTVSKAADKVDDVVSPFYNKEKAQKIADVIGCGVHNTPKSFAENVSHANPGYKGGKRDPLRNNCCHSVISWMLNETGVDCKAKPMSAEFIDGGMTPSEVNRFFSGLKGTWQNNIDIKGTRGVMEEEVFTQKIKDLCGSDKNAMGIWRATHNIKGGHYMGWIMKDGKVSFVNPQNGSFFCDDWFNDMSFGECKTVIDFARLDNLEINHKQIVNAVSKR